MRGQGKEREGRRQGAERTAAQPIGQESQAADEGDHPENPERAPSFLSARELQAREPAKGVAQDTTEDRTEKKPRSK
jgi:hypothetical protein